MMQTDPHPTPRRFCTALKCLLAAALLLPGIGIHSTSAADHPNILLIISDDQAWTDYGFMGHPHIQTPRLDKLAGEGLTFTRGYSTAPLCRPSLASMITGLYPHQHGITGNDPAITGAGRRYGQEWSAKRTELNQTLIANLKKHPPLPRLLAQQGYLSLQTGKWWEGPWNTGGFTHGMTHGDPTRGGRHGDEGLKISRESSQVIYDFIDEAVRRQKPFFIWHAPFLPHTPHNPPKRLEDKYLNLAPSPQVARYWAMCEWFDETCGQLLDHLDQKHLAQNTLVLYVCDNGWIQNPAKDNAFLPRSKQSPYEKGIRTPIMVRWPGHVQPRLDKTTLVSSLDLAPTILAASGLAPTPEMPGINLLDANALAKRPRLFAEAYDHDIADVAHPTRSLKYRVVLEGPWKLILPHRPNLPDASPELYNLIQDPDENHNLATEHPDRVRTLTKLTDAWWTP